jgi:hypothetical protein
MNVVIRVMGAALAGAAILGVGACGGGAARDTREGERSTNPVLDRVMAQNPPVDPARICEKLDLGRLRKLTGDPWTSAELRRSPPQCMVTGSDAGTRVSVVITNQLSAETAQRFFEAGTRGGQAVSGVGDRAAFDLTGRLHVLVDTKLYEIQLVSHATADGAATLAADKEIYALVDDL